VASTTNFIAMFCRLVLNDNTHTHKAMQSTRSDMTCALKDPVTRMLVPHRSLQLAQTIGAKKVQV
jgi:hypothetical protein